MKYIERPFHILDFLGINTLPSPVRGSGVVHVVLLIFTFYQPTDDINNLIVDFFR